MTGRVAQQLLVPMLALEQDTLGVEPTSDAQLQTNTRSDKRRYTSVTPIQIKIKARKGGVRTKSANELRFVDAS